MQTTTLLTLMLGAAIPAVAQPTLADLSREVAASARALVPGVSSLAALSGLSALSSFAPRDLAEPDQAADSLYRMGRRALDRGDYRRAAELFMQVRARDRKAAIAGDALYWHAFASARLGSTTGLQTALSSLDALATEFPRAVNRDARALRVRVCGALASQGNEGCAREIREVAGASGGSGSSSGGSGSASGGTRPRATSQEQGCPDDDDDERVEALNALLQMDADAALPILEKTLARRDRCSAALRRKAIFLVSQKREARAADILMNSLRSDPDGEVREQAVFWLGQLRDDRAVTMLEEILKTEKDEDVLDKAVFALSQHRSPRAAAMLRDLAQRDNAPKQQREQAIFWLGQQKSAENATLLIGLFARVNDEELKDKIIFSLSQVRSPATDKWMMDLATNEKEDVEIRKKALFWAGQNKAVSIEALGQMYDRVTDREMREQVIFVLAQRRDAGAVDKLIDIARTDKDREMRKRAIFWLGQSKDPKALKAIEELITR
ncbi:MAG: HEAT repeat domain-containing protein [Gemmatimonadetes bacterium]|nr:HEAT repeat domain-containing protein [Gemmatimonadota bacterium]